MAVQPIEGPRVTTPWKRKPHQRLGVQLLVICRPADEIDRVGATATHIQSGGPDYGTTGYYNPRSEVGPLINVADDLTLEAYRVTLAHELAHHLFPAATGYTNQEHEAVEEAAVAFVNALERSQRNVRNAVG